MVRGQHNQFREVRREFICFSRQKGNKMSCLRTYICNILKCLEQFQCFEIWGRAAGSLLREAKVFCKVQISLKWFKSIHVNRYLLPLLTDQLCIMDKCETLQKPLDNLVKAKESLSGFFISRRERETLVLPPQLTCLISH